MTEGHTEIIRSGCYGHIQHRACQAACAAGGWALIAEQHLRHV